MDIPKNKKREKLNAKQNQNRNGLSNKPVVLPFKSREVPNFTRVTIIIPVTKKIITPEINTK